MHARRITIAAAVAVAAIAVTGCSTVSTEPDQIGLHYSGGPLSSKEFESCIDPSKRQVDGPGDRHYVYPTSQRTFDATGGDKAESKPFTAVSQDSAEMLVPVTVTLTLKSDCETVRTFHERLGNRYKAYWQGSSEDFVDTNEDDIPDGWVTMLNFVVGKPLDTTIDRVAQQYPWRKLWNDPATKATIEDAVEKELAEQIARQAGGDFFDVGEVLVQKPDPANKALKDAVAAEQAAVSKAQSAKAEADAQVAAANAQVAVARAQAAQVAEQVRVLGVDGYVKKYAIDNDITPYPAPVVAGQAAPK